MKILLAVVMSLSVASSVWAACDANTPSDCKAAGEKACTDAGHVWKKAETGIEAGCVKKTETGASQTQTKACDQIVGNGGVGAKASTATTVDGAVKTDGKEK